MNVCRKSVPSSPAWSTVSSCSFDPPTQVTGPSLTPAQTKFLSALLRAPTLSYPGGLLMLEAFRGRSGKEVVAR